MSLLAQIIFEKIQENNFVTVAEADNDVRIKHKRRVSLIKQDDVTPNVSTIYSMQQKHVMKT